MTIEDPGSCPTPQSPVTAHVERSQADAPHSPLPWWNVVVSPEGARLELVGIEDADSQRLADMCYAEGVDFANAAFIVRAVNSHDELVAALKSCIELCDRELIGDLDLMRRALKKAEGQP